jgi:hypothetical protein
MDPRAAAPGRRQLAPAASAGRGRGGDEGHHRRLVRLGQRRSRPRTPPNWPLPPTKQPSPVKSPNVTDEDAPERWPTPPYSASSNQAAGQHGHAESASPGARPRTRPKGATIRPEWVTRPDSAPVPARKYACSTGKTASRCVQCVNRGDGGAVERCSSLTSSAAGNSTGTASGRATTSWGDLTRPTPRRKDRNVVVQTTRAG